MSAPLTKASANDPEAPVEVVPYDTLWPLKFEAERSLLEVALARWLAGPIEHIGSTAVPSPRRRTHHLHLVPIGSQLWHQRLAFRDALRQSPTLVTEYAEIKLRLAETFRFDREAYTEAKAPFVQRVLSGDSIAHVSYRWRIDADLASQTPAFSHVRQADLSMKFHRKKSIGR
jgi:GrpB-like predicted nucleotidyltransferase (UPF0157 family)